MPSPIVPKCPRIASNGCPRPFLSGDKNCFSNCPRPISSGDTFSMKLSPGKNSRGHLQKAGDTCRLNCPRGHPAGDKVQRKPSPRFTRVARLQVIRF